MQTSAGVDGELAARVLRHAHDKTAFTQALIDAAKLPFRDANNRAPALVVNGILRILDRAEVQALADRRRGLRLVDAGVIKRSARSAGLATRLHSRSQRTWRRIRAGVDVEDEQLRSFARWAAHRFRAQMPDLLQENLESWLGPEPLHEDQLTVGSPFYLAPSVYHG